MDEERVRGFSAVEAVSPGELGRRVRDLRGSRGMTLEGLAEHSGVSRAMLSKVERGEKTPTLVVAAKVAEGLGISLSQLAGIEERREVVVVPRDRQMVARDPETGFERQLLSPSSGGGNVEFVRSVLPEGATSGNSPPRRRGVEEYVVVEKGRLKAVLGGDEYMLDEGDALYFEADVTHRFDNVGREEASYYVVISAPDA